MRDFKRTGYASEFNDGQLLILAKFLNLEILRLQAVCDMDPTNTDRKAHTLLYYMQCRRDEVMRDYDLNRVGDY